MIRSLTQFGHNTFSSLKIRNYRLYYLGQIISTSGTFMQSVAQAWLVLQLSNSGAALGLVTALQYVPVLLFGPWGGVIADRFSKRKLLYFTQTSFGILALVLGLLVLTGWVRLWMVAVLAAAYGIVNALDNPTRQSFVVEMVGEHELRNAVTLYSSLVNLSRVIGPSIAGILIVTIGLAPCFIFNGLSYAAVIIMLAVMRASELRAAPPVARARGQLSAGFRYIVRTPVLRGVLLMLAIIGTFTFEFQVSLPLLAQFTFHGNAESYAALTSAMGIGAVIGGLLTAGQRKTPVRTLVLAAFFFGLTTFAAAMMPTLFWAVAAMLAVGFFSIYCTSLGNSILQLSSEPQMRGRVMAFWSIAFIGSTTIGGPIVGWIGEFDPRWGLGLGGLAAVIAAGLGALTLRGVPMPKSAPGSQAAEQVRSEERIAP